MPLLGCCGIWRDIKRDSLTGGGGVVGGEGRADEDGHVGGEARSDHERRIKTDEGHRGAAEAVEG